MIGFVFHVVFYTPLYNGLIFLIDILPGADAGVAIIILTCLVKLILFPLSQKAIREQLKMKETNAELNQIKEKYKNDREGQARAIMAFYKEKKINPFSSILVLLIQLPIIIALYWVFYQGGLPVVNSELLYPFVQDPGSVGMVFLGLLDITKSSYLLATIAAVAQFFQFKLSMPPVPETKPGAVPSLQESLAKSMSVQMKYVFPALIFFIAYKYYGVVALYLITSSLFAIGQELYVRGKLKNNQGLRTANK